METHRLHCETTRILQQWCKQSILQFIFFCYVQTIKLLFNFGPLPEPDAMTIALMVSWFLAPVLHCQGTLPLTVPEHFWQNLYPQFVATSHHECPNNDSSQEDRILALPDDTESADAVGECLVEEQECHEELGEDVGPEPLGTDQALAILSGSNQPTPLNQSIIAASSLVENVQFVGQQRGGARTSQIFLNYMHSSLGQIAEIRAAALGILSQLPGLVSTQDDEENNRLIITCAGRSRSSITLALRNAESTVSLSDLPEEKQWVAEMGAQECAPCPTAPSRRESRRALSSMEDGLVIPRTNFRLLCREIVQDLADSPVEAVSEPLRFNVDGLIALQAAAESFLQELFSVTNLLCIHAKRVTIFPHDMKLAAMTSAERASTAASAGSSSSSSSSHPSRGRTIEANDKGRGKGKRKGAGEPSAPAVKRQRS